MKITDTKQNKRSEKKPRNGNEAQKPIKKQQQQQQQQK
jgi:hypothetical protein